jgi:hypothetical protein
LVLRSDQEKAAGVRGVEQLLAEDLEDAGIEAWIDQAPVDDPGSGDRVGWSPGGRGLLEVLEVHAVGEEQGGEAVGGEAWGEVGIDEDEAVEAGKEGVFAASEGGAIPVGPGGVIIEAVVDPATGGEASDQVGDERECGEDDGGDISGGQMSEELGGVELSSPTRAEGGPEERFADLGGWLIAGGSNRGLPPAAKLFHGAAEGVGMAAPATHADDFNPGDRGAWEQMADEVLATGGVPPPGIGEDEQGRVGGVSVRCHSSLQGERGGWRGTGGGFGAGE